jgi:hypothetical protein
MKSIKFLMLGLLIVGSAFLTSCKKEGCTDADSKTFNADAKKDNGTCQYEGSALLWYNQAASTGLQNDGATTLIYYVDGQVVGSGTTSVFWTAGPECGQNGSITVTKDLGGVKNKSYTYSVKDQTGFEYWAGVLNFTANSCEAVQLTW